MAARASSLPPDFAAAVAELRRLGVRHFKSPRLEVDLDPLPIEVSPAEQPPIERQKPKQGLKRDLAWDINAGRRLDD